MKIETVNVMIGVRANAWDQQFQTQIMKAGAEAIPVTEIPIYQLQHGDDCISMVSPAGSYESLKRDEFSRLQRKFPSKFLNAVYASGRVPMPSSIDDLDLSPAQMDTRKTRMAKAPSFDETEEADKDAAKK